MAKTTDTKFKKSPSIDDLIAGGKIIEESKSGGNENSFFYGMSKLIELMKMEEGLGGKGPKPDEPTEPVEPKEPTKDDLIKETDLGGMIKTFLNITDKATVFIPFCGNGDHACRSADRDPSKC